MIESNTVISPHHKELLWEAIDTAQRIAICGHANPDGDCLGSCMAMGSYCEELGKEVTYHVPTDGTHGIDFFDKVADFTTVIDDHTKYDLFLCIDTANIERTSLADFSSESIASKLYVIDHHLGNEFTHGTLLIDHTTSSACELVAQLLEERGFDLTLHHARVPNYLFMGILTDTGNFSRGQQPAKTLRVAAQLIEYGADKNWLMDNLFRKESFEKIKEIGSLLGRIQKTDSVIWTAVTTSELKKKGIEDGGIGHLLYTMQKIEHDGIYAMIKIVDDEEQGAIKMSLRTRKQYNVCTIAQHYGGGGHEKAAGLKIMLQGDADEMLERVIGEIDSMVSNQR